MTDEAAKPRRPATTEGADTAQPPLPGEASPVRAHTLPAHQPATAAPGVDQNPDDQPTAEVPVPPAAEAPGPPKGSPAAAEATTEPGAPGPGGTPPPWWYGPPAGPPPAAGTGFTSRYGLVRPRQGRYLAGVCAAIGRATNTDPVLWRVLLAMLGFFGGIGILVYVAAWLIIPAEGDSASPMESMLGRGRSSMSPVTVIILGVLAVVMFGFIVTNEFRAVLLGAAILIGGALLLNRNGARATPATGDPAQPGGAPAGSAPPAGSWSAAPAGTWSGDPIAPGGDPATTHPAFAGPVPPGGPYPAPAPAGAGYPTYPPETPSPPYLVAAGPSAAASAATPAPAAWPAATPAMPASTPPGGPFGPLPPGGYRPPFAPHGPYATAGWPYPPGAVPAPPKPPKPPKERSPLGAATFSMIFVAIGAVAVLDLTVVQIEPSAYFAGALVTIALGLLVGAWFGRARWLIALGVVATVALGISTLASFDDKYTGSDIVWTPMNYDELATHYESNFGNTTLDLTSVDFTDRNAQVTIKIAFGELTVIVPPSVDVTVKANISAGDANVFDHYWGGVGMPSRTVSDLGDDGPGGGTLQLDLDVVGGNVEVRR